MRDMVKYYSDVLIVQKKVRDNMPTPKYWHSVITNPALWENYSNGSRAKDWLIARDLMVLASKLLKG
jgi:hypothetical protein